MFRMTFWNELKKSEIINVGPNILPSSSYCEFCFFFLARGEFGVWFISTKSGEKNFSVDRYCRFCNTSCKIPYIRQFRFFFSPAANLGYGSYPPNRAKRIPQSTDIADFATRVAKYSISDNSQTLRFHDTYLSFEA